MLTYSEYYELVAKGLKLVEKQIQEAQAFTQQEFEKAIARENTPSQEEPIKDNTTSKSSKKTEKSKEE